MYLESGYIVERLGMPAVFITGTRAEALSSIEGNVVAVPQGDNTSYSIHSLNEKNEASKTPFAQMVFAFGRMES